VSQKVVHLAEGIENEKTVPTALLLYKARILYGIVLLA
jgi:hypothetical protein